MKLRLFLVVLAVSLVLLPIYFFNLPSELVPRSSQQVINYFYDTRTYIGIQRMVASSNDDNIGKGIHRNLKGEEDLYRDDDGERKEKETRSSSLSSPSPTSPSQKPHSLTDEQEKSLAQDTPKPLVTPPLQKASAQRVKLPPRLTSIPQYLMSQVQSHLSGLGLNAYSKMLQEKRKRPHGAAWKAMQKLSKRSYEAARKERVKALMRMRLRQRIEMQQLPVTVNCTDKACEQLKDLRERYYYEACLKEAQTEHEVKPCQCTLLDGKKRGRYALLSLPGSGNTWVRGLLEKATGVCTGSMWCDPSLRAKHFCMEGVRSTSVLVVKNHDTHLRWVGVPLGDGESVNNKPDFIGGILIHRNPFRATIAEWNRDAAVILTANITDEAEDFTQATQTILNYNQPTSSEAVFKDVLSSETRKAVHRLHRNVTSDSLGATKNHHLSYFGKEMFGSNMGWNATVYLQAEKWRRMIEHYIINNRVQPILVVKYEDLKADPVTQVKRMLTFLHYPYQDGEVEERLKGGFSYYYRNHTDTFEHYTPEQIAHINSVIKSVIDKLKQENITNFIPLEPYLRL